MDQLIHDDDPIPHHERELTLSTGSILGIFFGLALLCGAFFAFGYNVGHKAVATPLALPDSGDTAITSGSGGAKPAAGSPMDTGAPPATVEAPVVAPVKPKPIPKPVPPPAAPADATAVVPTEAHTAHDADTAAPIVRPVPAPATSASPTGLGSSYMVQVAAVSHQEDADLLVGALRARGYAVTAHPVAGDSFIHVQVGPFHDKPAADAMRQRLIADGYNAIVKF